MANSKDNLSKYGKGFIGFDEPSGNAMDSIGGWTGTLYNSPVRVKGWNDQEYAMQFNGTNQYVQFNNSVIPMGTKSIRLKYKISSFSATTGMILLSNREATTGRGIQIWIDTSGRLNVGFAIQKTWDVQIISQNTAISPQWKDLLVTWDGTTNADALKVYLDDMSIPLMTGTVPLQETVPYSGTLFIGRLSNTTANFLNGQLDAIEIYDRIISPIPDKYLVQHNSQYKYHNGISWQATTATETSFKQYGMSQLSQITETQWKELSGAKSLVMWSDFEDKKWANAVLNIEPVKINKLLGDSPEVIYYTDSGISQIVVETEVEPYSVYDYIGELPNVITYKETTHDMIISTTTEPFDIYDEFGDNVDVLYYTDDTNFASSELVLEANWSPIDELEGDFDVITWTEEEGDSVARKIEMQATPKPQFIRLVDKKRVYGYLKDIIIPESSKGKKYVRFFLSPDDTTYYVWDKSNQQFKTTSFSNETDILNLGMTSSDLDSITEIQWSKWQHEFVNICIFLKDNARDTTISSIDNMSYNSLAPTNTNNISSLSLYILNTTAKINVELQGNLLKGTLSDDDLTRVQYRVILNNKNFYPKDGNFTALSPSPQNINLEIPTKEMIIGGINTLKVEFQDFFGTTDYWLHQFIGEYSGVMFADEQNKYYSTDTGEILRSLDFGTIIAGQTSQVKIIYIQNKHSFDIHNIMLSKLSNSLPDGVELQISKTNQPFVPEESLMFEDLLHYNDKLAFYARLKTIKNTEPGFGEFDIGVKADPIK